MNYSVKVSEAIEIESIGKLVQILHIPGYHGNHIDKREMILYAKNIPQVH